MKNMRDKNLFKRLVIFAIAVVMLSSTVSMVSVTSGVSVPSGVSVTSGDIVSSGALSPVVEFPRQGEGQTIGLNSAGTLGPPVLFGMLGSCSAPDSGNM